MEFFLKACDYYVDKIVRAVLERNLPSFHELGFAQERLHILRSEYYKLSVVADEMLSKVLEELKTVDSELAKREATS